MYTSSLRAITIKVLLDNEPFLPGLRLDWGLSILVEGRGGPRLLMDTGSSASRLLGNAEELGVDLANLDGIFISHWHGDHCGGLPGLLDITGSIDVFVPREPGWLMKRELRGKGARLVVLRGPARLVNGFYSTGDLGGEHSLIADVEGLGLAVLTGCSHPGPDLVVRTASSYLRKPVHALIGGFHISSYYEGRKLGTFLAQQGLKVVCPCHCTGSPAKRGLRDVLGDVVLQCGVGMELKLEARGGASKQARGPVG